MNDLGTKALGIILLAIIICFVLLVFTGVLEGANQTETGAIFLPLVTGRPEKMYTNCGPYRGIDEYGCWYNNPQPPEVPHR